MSDEEKKLEAAGADMDQVVEFFDALNIGMDVSELIADLGISDMDDLLFIDEDMLKETELKPIARRKILSAVQGDDESQQTSTKTIFESNRPKATFPHFKGHHDKWDSWKRSIEAAFGQLGLDHVLKSDALGTADEQEYIFNVLKEATAEGSARLRILRGAKTRNGSHAWEDLCAWYEGTTSKSLRNSEVRLKMHSAQLNESCTATEYINCFVEALATLEERDEAFPEEQAVELFIHGIVDEDYQQIRATFDDERIRGQQQKFDDLVKRLRNRERTLIERGTRTPTGRRRARRARDQALKNQGGDNPSRKRNGNRNPRPRRDKRRQDHEYRDRPPRNSDAPTTEQPSEQRPRDDDAKKPAGILKTKASKATPERIDEATEQGFRGIRFKRDQRNRRVSSIRRRATSPDPRSVIVVDGGTETSMVNDMWTVLEERDVNQVVAGFDGTEQKVEKIVSAAAVLRTHDGERIVGIIHEAHYVPYAPESLLQPNQVRHHGHDVDDVPREYGGEQHMVVDQFVLPLQRCGPCLQMHSQVLGTDDMIDLPAVELTANVPWDPEQGRSVRRTVTRTDYTKEDIHFWRKALSLPDDVMTLRTLKATTQSAKRQLHGRMRRHLKARFPQLNVRRLNEKVFTDTYMPGCKSRDGHEFAQIFASQYGYFDIYGMQRKSQFPSRLESFIKDAGAPRMLISDNAKEETSAKVQDILRRYMIQSGTSEPHHQWQNFAERSIQHLKYTAEKIMRDHQVPEDLWYQALLEAAETINHRAKKQLRWRTPYERRHGETPDISHLGYQFFQSIVYLDPDARFPESREKPGRLLAPAKSSGDAMARYIETPDGTILIRSTFKPSNSNGDLLGESNNWEYQDGTVFTPPPPPFVPDANRYAPLDPGETPEEDAPDDEESEDDGPEISSTTAQEPNLTETVDTRIGARMLKEFDEGSFFGTVRRFDSPYYHVEYDDGDEEDMNGTEVDAAIRAAREFHLFDEIIGHRRQQDILQMHVRWNDGTTTWEPASMLRRDDPLSVAQYLRDYVENSDIDTRMKRWMQRTLRNRRKTAKRVDFKFGVDIPRSVRRALAFDNENGNDLWEKAIEKELNALIKMDTFKFVESRGDIPSEYDYAPLHFVFDVKVDLRRKARLVIGGNVLDDRDPTDRYAPVMQLRSSRILAMLAKRKRHRLRIADIGNAYINADTREKVWSKLEIPTPSGPRTVYVIVIKALYGLQTSGREWCAHLARTLKDMGFQRSKADISIWMRWNPEHHHWDYIGTYVDDLIISAVDPEMYLNQLRESYELKNVDDLHHYLGAGYEELEDHTFRIDATKYIKDSIDRIERELEHPLREYNTPALANDHPELDKSDFLDEGYIRKYQQLVGIGNWLVTITRYDIAFSIASLSRFSSAPREGHLKRLYRVFGYVKRFPDISIVMDPTPLDIEVPEFRWQEDHLLEYPNADNNIVAENDDLVPDDWPQSDGTVVDITIFCDADHGHDKVTGKSITGLFVFLGSAPTSWSSRRQTSVSTSTYGAELMALKSAVEEERATRTFLRLLGVSLGRTMILGDNMGVLQSTLPGSELKKKNYLLAYHFIRERLASGELVLGHVPSAANIADILTKVLGRVLHWSMINMLPQI